MSDFTLSVAPSLDDNLGRPVKGPVGEMASYSCVYPREAHLLRIYDRAGSRQVDRWVHVDSLAQCGNAMTPTVTLTVRYLTGPEALTGQHYLVPFTSIVTAPMARQKLARTLFMLDMNEATLSTQYGSVAIDLPVTPEGKLRGALGLISMPMLPAGYWQDVYDRELLEASVRHRLFGECVRWRASDAVSGREQGARAIMDVVMLALQVTEQEAMTGAEARAI